MPFLQEPHGGSCYYLFFFSQEHVEMQHMLLHVCLRQVKSLTRLVAPLHFGSRYQGAVWKQGLTSL